MTRVFVGAASAAGASEAALSHAQYAMVPSSVTTALPAPMATNAGSMNGPNPSVILRAALGPAAKAHKSAIIQPSGPYA